MILKNDIKNIILKLNDNMILMLIDIILHIIYILYVIHPWI